MVKMSGAGCLGVCEMILAQFTLEMCVAAWNREKFTLTKNPIFGVQGRSFKVIDVGTPEKLVSSAWYDKQQVCVYLEPLSWQTS